MKEYWKYNIGNKFYKENWFKFILLLTREILRFLKVTSKIVSKFGEIVGY